MARRSLTWPMGCVMALVFVAIPLPSAAARRLEITVLGASSDSPGMLDGQTYGLTTMFTLLDPSLSFGDSASSGDGSALSSGSVGYGWARSLASASHSAADEGVTRTSNATTQSLFRDDLIITSPGMSGGGTVTFLIEVSGGLAAMSLGDTPSTDASADWNAYARASTAPSEAGRIAEGSLIQSSFGVIATGDLTGGEYEWGPIPFGFGSSFEVTIALNTSVDVDFCCSAAANFESTLTWEGVVEIRDGNGALADDFEITSGSGANFGEPISVPEPASEALALMSLLTTALLIRTRRSRQ